MIMENIKASAGIRQILNLLGTDEVLKLAATTTQNLVKPEVIRSKQEALEIIIRHSPDISTILNRKTVTREILFQYLNDNGFALHPPLTKLSLIQRTLTFWGNTNTNGGDDKQISVKSYTNSNEINPESSDQIIKKVDDISLMATKFAQWFYSMMNDDTCIGEEHFWQDCSLKLSLISATACIENDVNNDNTEVVKLLYNTKREHNLYFNPNLSDEGVKGKMDAHGLVMVFACGTLHTRERCVGVFEQVFALARDPFSENNWKIKNTRLSLKSKDLVNETPRLCDSDLREEVLSVTET